MGLAVAAATVGGWVLAPPPETDTGSLRLGSRMAFGCNLTLASSAEGSDGRLLLMSYNGGGARFGGGVAAGVGLDGEDGSLDSEEGEGVAVETDGRVEWEEGRPSHSPSTANHFGSWYY